MSNTLILGAGGFVGRYLINELSRQTTPNDKIYATKLPGEEAHTPCNWIDLDITNPQQVNDLIKTVLPKQIFHLAAISSVAYSWKNPALTFETNLLGSTHLLTAIRNYCEKARLLIVGSSEEYGPTATSEISEDSACNPQNPYAISKLAQNQLATIYQKAYNLNIVSVRAFNHVGPYQSENFVVADFCKQIAKIEAGILPPIMHVGNLSALRDFTDVRDIVSAYVTLMQQKHLMGTYNVGTGHPVSIHDILSQLLSLSSTDITVKTDPQKYRPIETPSISPDISRLTADTHWTPSIPLQTTLKDTLNYWRDVVHAQ